MLWVYPVLDGLIRNAVDRPVPSRVARVDGAAAVTRIGAAACRHHGRRRRPDEDGEDDDAADNPSGGHEPLLTPGTLTALQEIRAADAEIMIRAMIAAAKCDGTIDAEERRRIFTELNELGADPEDRALMQRLMDEPLDLEDLFARVQTPEMALEVYTASLLAIDVDQPVERSYLATVARRLKLDPAVVERLHRQFGDPPPL